MVKLASIALALMAAAGLAAQQSPPAPSPAPSPQPAFRMPPPTPNDTLKSVEILADRHVTFRIYAPKASSVILHPEGPEATPGITPDELAKTYQGFPMTKDEQGVWTATIGPIAAGVYRYHFDVDGVFTADPKTSLRSESLTNARSLYEVPGNEAIAIKPEIAHGAVASVTYYSKATTSLRRMHIYTPPGYEAGSARLPVLYLLHGGGDSDDSWWTVGRAGIILDNLIAAGKALPMIVVMPAGHISANFRLTPGFRMGHDAFNDDLVHVVLPYVDANYRTVADRDHRAIAGLSMGGAQALNISLESSDQFAWVGLFSTGWFGNTLEDEKKTTLANWRASGKPFTLYWVGVGQYDIALQNSRATVAALNEAGIKTAGHESGGFHAWNNWRDYLGEFAPLLFK